MNSFCNALSSTLGKKLIVGITGLLLIGFILAHLAGNLLLYVGADAYDRYAHTLHSNPLLPIFEIGLLVLFVLHIVVAIRLAKENRQARPQKYEMRKSKQGRASFNAANVMVISGIFVLGFILLHLADMRFQLRHPVAEGTSPALRTMLVLQDPISAVVYFFGSLFLGYHLWHAIQSVFQTLGLNGPKFSLWTKRIGWVLAVFFAVGFAGFPVWAYLVKMGII